MPKPHRLRDQKVSRTKSSKPKKKINNLVGGKKEICKNKQKQVKG